MGLDMYLTKEIYVGANYQHRNVTGVVDIKVGEQSLGIDLSKVSYVTEQVGYWRKANAIHKWFVDNVQEGVDNCEKYYVSTEQLQDLKDRCEKVIANHALAEELLPPQAGFFFGSTGIDEYYFEDLETTIKILTEVFNGSEGDFYYQSSW